MNSTNRTVAVLANLFMLDQMWVYFLFYTVLEILLYILIVWYAWKWPTEEA